MKKIVITGGLGYIGMELAKVYSGKSKDYKIYVLDNKFHLGRVSRLNKWGIKFIQCDILDKVKLKPFIEDADIILLGVSRTSKTPTSIYLANRGYETLNIPLVGKQDPLKSLINNSGNFCIIGLSVEAKRLFDIRSNRLKEMKEHKISSYSNLDFIQREIEDSKKLFRKYNWPIINVTRKSVEETAASIIRIFDIKKRKKK